MKMDIILKYMKFNASSKIYEIRKKTDMLHSNFNFYYITQACFEIFFPKVRGLSRDFYNIAYLMQICVVTTGVADGVMIH